MPPFNISLSAFNVAVIGLGLNIGAYGAEVFFFFKQKTAYEIDMGLEFRRVLFRSLHQHAPARIVALPVDVVEGVAAEGMAFRHARLPVGGPGRVERPVAAYCLFVRQEEGGLRSEERRVGKEWRALWSASHVKKEQ